MWMKLLINTIMKITTKVKNNFIFLTLLYGGIIAGVILIFVFLSTKKVEFIYTQF